MNMKRISPIVSVLLLMSLVFSPFLGQAQAEGACDAGWEGTNQHLKEGVEPLSIDVWTDKGGQGQNVADGTYNVGDPITIYKSVNKDCTARMNYQKSDFTVINLGTWRLSAGVYPLTWLTVGGPAGTHGLIFEAWTDGERAFDDCWFEVKDYVHPLSIDVWTDKGGQGHNVPDGTYTIDEDIIIRKSVNKVCYAEIYLYPPSGSRIHLGPWWLEKIGEQHRIKALIAEDPIGKWKIEIKYWTGETEEFKIEFPIGQWSIEFNAWTDGESFGDRCDFEVIREDLADLIISDISWSPEEPQVGDEIDISFTVKNIGYGTAYDFEHAGGTYPRPGGYQFAGENYHIDSLAPGKTKPFTVSFIIDAGFAETCKRVHGELGFKFTVITDVEYDRVTESNEHNNSKEVWIPFEEEQRVPKLCVVPDLPSHDFGRVPEGEQRAWIFQIENCGDGTLEWQVSVDKPWITVKPTSGTTATERDSIEVTIDTSGLSGSNEGTLSITSNGGNKQGTIKVEVGPEEPYRDLAAHWAPVWYQDTVKPVIDLENQGYRGDYITNFNFDGDWKGINNWENLVPCEENGCKTYPLKAYIYYWVVETETNWYVGYADFHPRDWKSKGIEPHENDMEGCILMIDKIDGELSCMLTMAHLGYKDYYPDKDEDGIDFEGGRPVVYVEAKGHGVYGKKSDAYPGPIDEWEEDEDFPGSDGVIYRYEQGIAEEPKGDEMIEEVDYALIGINELWDKRYDYDENYDGPKDDYPYPFARFGIFRGGNDLGRKTNAARAPWGWQSNDAEPPDLFMDPAYVIYPLCPQGKEYESFHTYVSRSCGGVVESFHPYRANYVRTWTWKVEDATQIRVRFKKIELDPTHDMFHPLGDRILISDGNESVRQEILCTHSEPVLRDYWCEWVEGDTIKIALSTDAAPSSWGFWADLVEVKGLPALQAAYGASKVDVEYNPDADLNGDGIVDYKDLAILGSKYGQGR